MFSYFSFSFFQKKKHDIKARNTLAYLLHKDPKRRATAHWAAMHALDKQVSVPDDEDDTRTAETDDDAMDRASGNFFFDLFCWFQFFFFLKNKSILLTIHCRFSFYNKCKTNE